jgi:hypothetical protein
MLISHRKRFIYTKTVKTAGTSVESYFEPYCMREGEWTFTHARPEYVSETGIIGIRTGDPLELQGATWWNHMPARTIRALIGEEIWNTYFKFCVVRNPFDAMVSAYRYFAASKQRVHGLRKVLVTIGARFVPARRNRDLKGRFERWLSMIQLPLDRNKYLVDGRYCMDHAIRYEALEAGIQEVCQRLNVDFDSRRLPHLKNTEKPKSPLSAYYSDASIAIIERAFRFELDQFGYKRPW